LNEVTCSGVIRLYRSPGYRPDRRRPYQVYIDGVSAGDIWVNEVELFTVPEGNHSIQVRFEDCCSNVLELVVQRGRDIEIACAAASGLEFLDFVFKPDQYLHLYFTQEQAQSAET
jgi:hypothetical protein